MRTGIGKNIVLEQTEAFKVSVYFDIKEGVYMSSKVKIPFE